MKKFKTLPFAFAAALLLIGAGPLRPAFAGTYFDVSSVVSVSSQTASPTLLLAATSGSTGDVRIICTQWSLVGETVMLQSASTGFNTSITSGTARIPCLPNTVQQLDLQLNDYRGPIYAVAVASYPIPISIWRKR